MSNRGNLTLKALVSDDKPVITPPSLSCLP
jgi:hypothetical protein